MHAPDSLFSLLHSLRSHRDRGEAILYEDLPDALKRALDNEGYSNQDACDKYEDYGKRATASDFVSAVTVLLSIYGRKGGKAGGKASGKLRPRFTRPLVPSSPPLLLPSSPLHLQLNTFPSLPSLPSLPSP